MTTDQVLDLRGLQVPDTPVKMCVYGNTSLNLWSRKDNDVIN